MRRALAGHPRRFRARLRKAAWAGRSDAARVYAAVADQAERRELVRDKALAMVAAARVRGGGHADRLLAAAWWAGVYGAFRRA